MRRTVVLRPGWAIGLLLALSAGTGRAAAPPLYGPAVTFPPVSDRGAAVYNLYPFRVDTLAAVDLDGDGRTDLAVVLQGPDMVHVLKGASQGGRLLEVHNFGPPSYIEASVEIFDPLLGPLIFQHNRPRAYRGTAIADFPVDGSLGLAVADYSTSQLLYFNYTRAGQFFNLTFTSPTWSNPAAMAIGDFNKDGYPDLALANAGNDNVTIAQNNTRGTFQSRNDGGNGQDTGSFPVGVATADFNGDGLIDAATADSHGDDVTVHATHTFTESAGDVTAAFSLLSKITVGSLPSSIVSGDFNGDGKPDLAVTNQGSNSVSVLLNGGGGTTWARTDYPVGASPTAMIAADLDGDGKLDLAIANGGENTVSVLLGKGDGTFLPKSDYPVGPTPSVLVSGDFNGDGKLDLATANYGDDTVSILYHLVMTPGDANGDGTVTTADVMLMTRFYLGLSTPTADQLARADVRPKPGTNGRPYGDGRIGADDLNWVLRRALGLETAP